MSGLTAPLSYKQRTTVSYKLEPISRFETDVSIPLTKDSCPSDTFDLTMIRGRWEAYRARIRSELEPAFAGENPPRVVAASFAIGLFITALPTLGTGLIVMAVIAHFSNGVSKIALFSSIAVLNPLAKGGVYLASFSLGTKLLGPIPEISLTEISLSAGPAVVTRLLVGNAILAALFAATGYVFAHRAVRVYRRIELGDILLD